MLIIQVWVKKLETEDEVIEWIIKNQFGRRNLNSFQRSELAYKLEDVIKAKAKERQLSTLKQNATDVQKSAPREKSKSRDELAKIAGVSYDTIEKAESLYNRVLLLYLICSKLINERYIKE